MIVGSYLGIFKRWPRPTETRIYLIMLINLGRGKVRLGLQESVLGVHMMYGMVAIII